MKSTDYTMMNEPKSKDEDEWVADESQFEWENEPDWGAFKEGLCPYCHSELDVHLVGDYGAEYCEMCGMDL